MADSLLPRTTVEQAFNFAKTARERFETGDDTVKREILAALGTNWTLKDTKVSVRIEEPLKHIANCVALVRTMQKWSNNRFEPKINEAHRREIGGPVYGSPKMLPG